LHPANPKSGQLHELSAKFLQFDTTALLQRNKTPVELRTGVLFCTHLLSPPPSEKVDLPQAARLGAFFLGLPCHILA
jgi:hypothetical protein